MQATSPRHRKYQLVTTIVLSALDTHAVATIPCNLQASSWERTTKDPDIEPLRRSQRPDRAPDVSLLTPRGVGLYRGSTKDLMRC